MTKEEALKYVVAFSCCTVGGLSCEDCPFNDVMSKELKNLLHGVLFATFGRTHARCGYDAKIR